MAETGTRGVLSLGDALVFDDLLPLSAYNACWQWFESQNFSFMNAVNLRKVFRLDDGKPLVGSPVEHTRQRERQAIPVVAIDALFSALDAHAEAIDRFLGQSWSGVQEVAYAYPAGTGLSWHTDGPSLGSLLYYMHPAWGAHWGGELLIASGASSRAAPERVTVAFSASEAVDHRPFFDTRHEDRCILADAHGVFLSPKPNRLVILKPGVKHMLKRVEPAAGNAVRCSLAALFTGTTCNSTLERV